MPFAAGSVPHSVNLLALPNDLLSRLPTFPTAIMVLSHRDGHYRGMIQSAATTLDTTRRGAEAPVAVCVHIPLRRLVSLYARQKHEIHVDYRPFLLTKSVL